VPRLKVDNLVFYRQFDISKYQMYFDGTYRKGTFKKQNLITDIEEDIKTNPGLDYVPPYQTENKLLERMWSRQYWKDLYFIVDNILMRYYTKEFKLVESWANKSDETNQFDFHNHVSDITVVYYLHNRVPEFGTNIDDKVIIPGVEDSLLIFDGKIRHKLCNMPKELAIHPNYHRYSIVLDFNIDKSKAT